MHSPGFDAHHHAVGMHHAAHHRAVGMHHAAHHRAAGMHHAAQSAATAHTRRSAGHDAFSAQLSGMPVARTVPRRVQPRRGRTGVITLLRFVFHLALIAVLAGVVLLVLRPTHPEWLAQIFHVVDGLVRMLRNAVS